MAELIVWTAQCCRNQQWRHGTYMSPHHNTAPWSVPVFGTTSTTWIQFARGNNIRGCRRGEAVHAIFVRKWDLVNAQKKFLHILVSLPQFVTIFFPLSVHISTHSSPSFVVHRSLQVVLTACALKARPVSVKAHPSSHSSLVHVFVSEMTKLYKKKKKTFICSWTYPGVA